MYIITARRMISGEVLKISAGSVHLRSLRARGLYGLSLFCLTEPIAGSPTPRSTGKLELKVLFDADAAVHLTESRLAADHRTTEQEDGRVLVEATVPDTNDLRWWLLGFGTGAKVLAPETLRAEFRDQAARMGGIYGV